LFWVGVLTPGGEDSPELGNFPAQQPEI